MVAVFSKVYCSGNAVFFVDEENEYEKCDER